MTSTNQNIHIADKFIHIRIKRFRTIDIRFIKLEGRRLISESLIIIESYSVIVKDPMKLNRYKSI